MSEILHNGGAAAWSHKNTDLAISHPIFDTNKMEY